MGCFFSHNTNSYATILCINNQWANPFPPESVVSPGVAHLEVREDTGEALIPLLRTGDVSDELQVICFTVEGKYQFIKARYTGANLSARTHLSYTSLTCYCLIISTVQHCLSLLKGNNDARSSKPRRKSSDIRVSFWKYLFFMIIRPILKFET